MSDSFLDHLPSTERRKLKKRMSPEAYERLREKVKGPQDLEKELQRSEKMAEMSFELQTDEKLRERLKAQADKDFREYGVERVVDTQKLHLEAKKLLEQGKFQLAVSSHPQSHEDHLVVVPEGNVHEKIPLKLSFSDRYVAQFIAASPSYARLRRATRDNKA